MSVVLGRLYDGANRGPTSALRFDTTQFVQPGHLLASPNQVYPPESSYPKSCIRSGPPNFGVSSGLTVSVHALVQGPASSISKTSVLTRTKRASSDSSQIPIPSIVINTTNAYPSVMNSAATTANLKNSISFKTLPLMKDSRLHGADDNDEIEQYKGLANEKTRTATNHHVNEELVKPIHCQRLGAEAIRSHRKESLGFSGCASSARSNRGFQMDDEQSREQRDEREIKSNHRKKDIVKKIKRAIKKSASKDETAASLESNTCVKEDKIVFAHQLKGAIDEEGKKDEMEDVDDEDMDKEEEPEEPTMPDLSMRMLLWASRSMWHHLIYTMIPIDIEAWQDQSHFRRILQIVQSPIVFVFRATIPVVFEEMADSEDEAGEEVEDEDIIEEHNTDPIRPVDVIKEQKVDRLKTANAVDNNVETKLNHRTYRTMDQTQSENFESEEIKMREDSNLVVAENRGKAPKGSQFVSVPIGVTISLTNACPVPTFEVNLSPLDYWRDEVTDHTKNYDSTLSLKKSDKFCCASTKDIEERLKRNLPAGEDVLSMNQAEDSFGESESNYSHEGKETDCSHCHSYNASAESEPLPLDLDSMHGWCKLLNGAQCIISPSICPLLLT
ncbi:unnamed protein product [Protopolystoma xenopodis]|uniref:Uncharacterized protein n=1 Tax=Protopolystoma xenopodis TaxID=117903 RepID=A0A448WC34_9PLAT|nr:unnamed protein product [Protopolystoma xenopodis]